MDDKVLLDDVTLGDRCAEISEEAAGLIYDDMLKCALNSREDAIGNVSPFLLLARQQDYLISVSELYKNHVENGVVDKLEVVKLRTRRAVTDLSDSIVNDIER